MKLNERKQKKKQKKTQESGTGRFDKSGFYITCTRYLLWNCASFTEGGAGSYGADAVFS